MFLILGRVSGRIAGDNPSETHQTSKVTMRRKERNSLTGDLAQMILKDAGSYGLLTEDLRLRSSLSDVAKAVFIEKLHTAIKKDPVKLRRGKNSLPY